MEWFEEKLHCGLSQRLSVDRVVFEQITPFQDLVIFENKMFGKVLALDGIIQTTEGDEYIYHEMLSHVPLISHFDAGRVLIIGGGDGGMAREVLKHCQVGTVTLVEIDPNVISLCQKYLPSIGRGAWGDSRLKVVVADGFKFVASSDEKWDIIIIDSTDPLGPSQVLFTERFYSVCKNCLTTKGILVTQNGVPYVQGAQITDSFRNLSRHFADVWFYLAPVPSYQGGYMAFGWASMETCYRTLTVQDLQKRIKKTNISTRYYNAHVHAAGFSLPENIINLLN